VSVTTMDELKKLLGDKKEELEKAETEPPPPPPGVVISRLRAQITMYGRQLDNERREHIRRVDTIATELVAIQDELIKMLEARIEEVETEMATLKLDRAITAEMAPIQMID
jgi:hypothetical protein